MDVELPDGTIIENVPEDITKEQLLSMLNRNNINVPEDKKEYGDEEALMSFEERPMSAAAIGFESGIPFGKRITSAIGAGIAKPFTNKDYGDLYSEALKVSEQAEEDNPIAYYGGGIGGAGITIPLAIGSAGKGYTGIRGAINKIPEASKKLQDYVAKGNTLSRIAKGATTGGIAGAIYSAGQAPEDEMLEGAKSGAGMGAALGGGIPVVGGAYRAGKDALTPVVDEGLKDVAKLARKYDIPLSLDQISSGRAIKTAQKISQDIPFSGQESFRDNQLKAWNKAVLKTIGVDSDRIDFNTMKDALTKIGKEFDKFSKGKKIEPAEISNRLNDLLNESGMIYSLDAQNNLKNIIKDVTRDIMDEYKLKGYVSGERLSKIRANLNRKMRKASLDSREAIADVESTLIDVISEDNPEIAKAFQETKNKYRNILALEPLSFKSRGGNISPTLLNDRVRRLYGRQYIKGKAGEIGDLARIGYELLPELGGSDTAAKMYLGAGLGIGSVVQPIIASGVVAGNRLAQETINRNQKIIDRLLRSGAKGNKLNPEDLMKLPPKDAEAVIKEVNKMKGKK